MATSGGPRPKRHQFECEPELWTWVEEQAERLDTSMTSVIVGALEQARRDATPPRQWVRTSLCARCRGIIVRSDSDETWRHKEAADHEPELA